MVALRKKLSAVRLLVIEHDDGVVSAVGAALGRSGHTWRRGRKGADALIHHQQYDLLLVALSLPDMDGLELLPRLRAVSSVPVIVLTSRNDERDVVRALRLGADDCLAKPPRPRELLARIDVAVRRRKSTTDAARPHLVEVGDLSVDLDARVVTRGNDVITLTKTEFDILAVLCTRCGTAVPRARILVTVWGDTSMATSRSLDVHLTRLRAKLNRPGLITTVWGHGYRLG